ncbi:MAG: hypothetical protein P1V20_18965, partial [Verrucomicrobiales bacterium]|nr:hypothetical protein [Verrucomicrobiales bacterium]
RPGFSGFNGLRQNGQIVIRQGESQRDDFPDVLNTDAVKLTEKGFLRRDGSFGMYSTRLQMGTGFAQVTSIDGYHVALRTDGTLEIFGNLDKRPKLREFFESARNVVAVQIRTHVTGRFLDRSGAVTIWNVNRNGGELHRASTSRPGSAISLANRAPGLVLGELRQLKLLQNGEYFDVNLNFPNRNVKYVFGYGGEWTFVTMEGRVYFWKDLRKPPTRLYPLLEEALHDAEMYYPHKGAGVIAALLPAETVSRSGFWKVEDLIADRHNLRQSKPSESVD